MATLSASPTLDVRPRPPRFAHRPLGVNESVAIQRLTNAPVDNRGERTAAQLLQSLGLAASVGEAAINLQESKARRGLLDAQVTAQDQENQRLELEHRQRVEERHKLELERRGREAEAKAADTARLEKMVGRQDADEEWSRVYADIKRLDLVPPDGVDITDYVNEFIDSRTEETASDDYGDAFGNSLRPKLIAAFEAQRDIILERDYGDIVAVLADGIAQSDDEIGPAIESTLSLRPGSVSESEAKASLLSTAMDSASQLGLVERAEEILAAMPAGMKSFGQIELNKAKARRDEMLSTKDADITAKFFSIMNEAEPKVFRARAEVGRLRQNGEISEQRAHELKRMVDRVEGEQLLGVQQQSFRNTIRAGILSGQATELSVGGHGHAASIGLSMESAIAAEADAVVESLVSQGQHQSAINVLARNGNLRSPALHARFAQGAATVQLVGIDHSDGGRVVVPPEFAQGLEMYEQMNRSAPMALAANISKEDALVYELVSLARNVYPDDPTTGSGIDGAVSLVSKAMQNPAVFNEIDSWGKDDIADATAWAHDKAANGGHIAEDQRQLAYLINRATGSSPEKSWREAKRIIKDRSVKINGHWVYSNGTIDDAVAETGTAIVRHFVQRYGERLNLSEGDITLVPTRDGQLWQLAEKGPGGLYMPIDIADRNGKPVVSISEWNYTADQLKAMYANSTSELSPREIAELIVSRRNEAQERAKSRPKGVSMRTIP